MKKPEDIDESTPEEYLYSLKRVGVKLGLDKIRDFLSNFGNPQNDFDCILVGGTNGKGSVATMISNILNEGGYKTGLYISPHQTYFEERISIDGENISKEKLWNLISRVKPVIDKIEENDIENRPSFFEVLTTLALMNFSDEDVDVAVLEVGLGGRLDATNVVDNIASVITMIGFDHSEYLGTTKKDIAHEKAGIIKKDNYFVTEEKDEKIRKYFKEVCEERGADYNYALDRKYEILNGPLRLKLPEYGIISVPGVAEWHAENTLTAITMAEGLRSRFNITKNDIVRGIEKTNLPGRMETIKKEPWIMMDSAHNLTGMQALVNGLKGLDYNRLLLVIGVLKDKDYNGIADTIGSLSDKVYTGEPISERKLNSETLAGVFSSYCPSRSFGKGIEAVKAAIEDWKEGDLILITGSIYLLGDVRKDGKDELW